MVRNQQHIMVRLGKLAATLAVLAASSATNACGTDGVAVQILGSGGPSVVDQRASASNIVWVDGRARVLVDAGGGAFLRFAESSAKIEDLSLIAITHLHADHVADLPALVKSGYFSDRTRVLPISGPSGGNDFPSLSEFLNAEFSEPRGAFRYLSGSLDGSDGFFKLEPRQVPANTKKPFEVFRDADLTVTAVSVPHGPVPALAYRVDVRGMHLVFSGDQNGSADSFWRLATNADLLIMAHAVPEDADPVARKVHATPSAIGLGAGQSRVKHMILTHLMARSLRTLDANIALIRKSYTGKLDIATDLACYPVPAP
ncbi:MAG: MBL fold metallo-hydrolase [Eggerthellaceae bacterium]|nr:MBL fold metallo-hydrolase [Eggerthellaceae bacterium]